MEDYQARDTRTAKEIGSDSTEEAGKKITMHVPILFVVIFLLVAGAEVLHMAFAVVIKTGLWLIGVGLAVGAVLLALAGSYEFYRLLVRLIGHAAAYDIGCATILLAVFVGLPALLVRPYIFSEEHHK